MKKSELKGAIECLTIQKTRLQFEVDAMRPKMNRITALEKANESQAKLITMLHLRNLELENIFDKSNHGKKIGAKK